MIHGVINNLVCTGRPSRRYIIGYAIGSVINYELAAEPYEVLDHALAGVLHQLVDLE